ncbi:MAG: hypothetical protein KU38_01455 [Sulfurovum sp. FS08-3]|nr:MAG: hypothetical protein KU38_01455 [Sulfurovum sp. FS08-3]
MTNRAFAYLFVSLSTLWGASRIEINAKDINSSNRQFEASHDVVAFANDAMIGATHLMYDKNTTALRLSGGVNILEYDGKNMIARAIEMNERAKTSHYQDAFIVTQEDFWLYSDTIDRHHEQYTFGPSIFSSCAIKNPDWIIGGERSLYDANRSKMKIYHAKVYAKNLPIFYFPYLSFSTKKERSSGLLFPTFGYNQNEGFIYEQPLFIAPYANWDIELNPQIRTKRSRGLYGTFRFKDTPYSYGSLRLGHFEDTLEYSQDNNLKNNTHYGLQFHYDSSDFLTSLKPQGFKDGLYTNITLLNDIDYINLQKDQMVSLLGSDSYIRESRMNYFLHNDNYYFGLYGKYFIDTRKSDSDNDDTIQELPTFHLHKSTAQLYNDLIYNVDLKSYNYFRKDGTKAQKIDFFLPLSFSHSFFDDYLTVELSHNIYATKVYFANSDEAKLDDYKYAATYTKVGLSSELTRIYDNAIHTIRPFIYYIHPAWEDESSVAYEDLTGEARELFWVDYAQESLGMGLSHYLYAKSGKLKFYHRLFYTHFLEGEATKGDIRNEMGYYGDTFVLYNNLIYSQEDKKIKSSLSSIGLNNRDFYLGATYYYNNAFELQKTKSVGLNFRYSVNDRLSLQGGVNYDLQNHYKTQWQFGLKYDRDCWSIALLFQQNTQPILTTLGADALENTSLTLQFNVVPFGTLGSP